MGPEAAWAAGPCSGAHGHLTLGSIVLVSRNGPFLAGKAGFLLGWSEEMGFIAALEVFLSPIGFSCSFETWNSLEHSFLSWSCNFFGSDGAEIGLEASLEA
jgi:hypothetical protein